MTVETTNVINGPLSCNGSTTSFPFTFKTLDDSEVTVVMFDAAGLSVTPGAYTVSPNTGAGGSVVFSAAPASGRTLYILSNPTFLQTAAFTNQGTFLPAVLNALFDRDAVRSQVNKGRIDRTFLVPVGEAGFEIPKAATRAAMTFRFDANGAPEFTPSVAASAEPPITAGAITEYWRGDKDFVPLNAAAIDGLAEFVVDTMAAAFVQGANVTISYNDPAGTITIAAAGGGGGGGLADGDYGSVTVSGTGTIITIDAAAVTLAMMANLGANTFIGSVAGGVPTALTMTAAGRALVDDADAAAQRATLGVDTFDIIFVIDGGGSVITTGIKGDLMVDFACTVQSWTVLGDQSGSIVVDIWKDTYANFPPVVGDTITGTEKPTISAATKGQDASLTSFVTAIAAGSILRFNVDSVTTLTRATVILKCIRA